MNNEEQMGKFARIIIVFGAVILIVYTFLTLMILNGFQARNVADVSRRVTAPNQTKTAILVRDLKFDLNFKLYVTKNPYDKLPFEIKNILWTSRDYDPSTQENWNEDIQWSNDSSIIAITIREHYVFAYDFSICQPVYDEEPIKTLLKTHNKQSAN